MAAAVGSSTGTAPGSKQPARYFTITHPFHPWRGRRLELIDCQRQWGQWRVYYLTKTGRRALFSALWTDAGPQDALFQQARGPARSRVGDVRAVVGLVFGGGTDIRRHA